jgi:hypothetical protein
MVRTVVSERSTRVVGYVLTRARPLPRHSHDLTRGRDDAPSLTAGLFMEGTLARKSPTTKLIWGVSRRS